MNIHIKFCTSFSINQQIDILRSNPHNRTKIWDIHNNRKIEKKLHTGFRPSLRHPCLQLDSMESACSLPIFPIKTGNGRYKHYPLLLKNLAVNIENISCLDWYWSSSKTDLTSGNISLGKLCLHIAKNFINNRQFNNQVNSSYKGFLNFSWPTRLVTVYKLTTLSSTISDIYSVGK